MAKSPSGYKTTKTENKAFHGRGPGNAGNGAPTAGGAKKKGDSRSKSMMAPIKPQKGC